MQGGPGAKVQSLSCHARRLRRAHRDPLLPLSPFLLSFLLLPARAASHPRSRTAPPLSSGSGAERQGIELHDLRLSSRARLAGPRALLPLLFFARVAERARPRGQHRSVLAPPQGPQPAPPPHPPSPLKIPTTHPSPCTNPSAPSGAVDSLPNNSISYAVRLEVRIRGA